jgi:cupin 2 domain-containing protein
MIKGNITKELTFNPNDEIFNTVFENKNAKIEQIISYGQTTPQGKWFVQDWDEWVLLLQGEAIIKYEDGNVDKLFPGDFVMIKQNTKHRVEYTLPDDYTIWLAVHLY